MFEVATFRGSHFWHLLTIFGGGGIRHLLFALLAKVIGYESKVPRCVSESPWTRNVQIPFGLEIFSTTTEKAALFTYTSLGDFRNRPLC